MSEVHHPMTHPKSIGALVIELLMISIAVFLGLLADQWRENRHLDELAKSALRNFRSEILVNQKRVADKKDYHSSLLKQLRAFDDSDGPHDRAAYLASVRFKGLEPVTFEHTAWDLAVSTQALVHIDPDLAYRISSVYTAQASFQTYEDNFLGTIAAPATLALAPALIAASMRNYFEDVALREPDLMKRYDDAVPGINVALGSAAR